MSMSNRLIQIKPVILNTEKKTGYYLDKKISQNTKIYITSLSNQTRFFLCTFYNCNGQ